MRHEALSDGRFFPVISRSAAAQVGSGATLLWSVESASWHEAMTLYHDWKGWKAYQPLDGDLGIYSTAQEAEALNNEKLTGEKQ